MSVILVSPTVSAKAPAVQVQTILDGYTIKYPIFGTIKQNQDFSFYFHIFNMSSGLPVGADYGQGETINCTFHLYNISGDHIVNSAVPYHPEDAYNEWGITIDKGNFTELGIYSYLLWCNSTYFGGFDSVQIEVTETGNILPEGVIIIFFSLLFILLCFEMLGLLLWTILHLLELNLDAKDLILNVSSYFALFAFYILQTRFLEDKFMSDFLVFLLEIGAVTTVLIPIIGFVISYIKQNMKGGDHN